MRLAKGPFFLLLFIAACAQSDFQKARSQEKAGRYEAALKSYLQGAERKPETRLAPEALFSAGRLAGDVLRDFPLAREIFQKILDRYGDQGQWGILAETALFNTPNYFPLVDNGKWEEGDSETGGKNARIQITCRPLESEPTAALTVHSYYAGNRYLKNLSKERIYRKTALELREYSDRDAEPIVILKYPFETGNQWASRRGGKKYIYTIHGTADVRVRAGEFKNCLVVREQPEGISSSWKLDYYAPGVGRVLTSLATVKAEKRNTELLSYTLSGGEEISLRRRTPEVQTKERS